MRMSRWEPSERFLAIWREEEAKWLEGDLVRIGGLVFRLPPPRGGILEFVPLFRTLARVPEHEQRAYWAHQRALARWREEDRQCSTTTQ